MTSTACTNSHVLAADGQVCIKNTTDQSRIYLIARAWFMNCYRRIVLGFEGEKNMPKLNFSGNLPNTIRNNILKLPVIPDGAFSNIQDGVQDGRQNVNTTI